MSAPAAPARSSRHRTDPPWVFGSLLRHRELVMQLAKREVFSRYRGSFFGMLWSLFNPLLMLAVYTFFFGTVLKVRWAESTSTAGFASILFVGMIVHGYFAECLIRSSSLIVGNPSYVRKVIFPLEILPWSTVAAAIFHTCASVVVIIVFLLVDQGSVPPTIVLLPLVLLPLTFFCVGFAWFVASLGVYVRDTAQIVGVLSSVLMFMSPVFYPITALAPEYRRAFELNPLTPSIEFARMVTLHGKLPPFEDLAILGLWGLLVAWLGMVWFQRTRNGFGDVL